MKWWMERIIFEKFISVKFINERNGGNVPILLQLVYKFRYPFERHKKKGGGKKSIFLQKTLLSYSLHTRLVFIGFPRRVFTTTFLAIFWRRSRLLENWCDSRAALHSCLPLSRLDTLYGSRSVSVNPRETGKTRRGRGDRRDEPVTI